MTCSLCEKCRARFSCIVDVYSGLRDREIVDEEKASETEVALEVVREKEVFFRSLRKDLESRLREYRTGLKISER